MEFTKLKQTVPLKSSTAKYLQLPLREKIQAAKDIGFAALLNILASIGGPLKDLISLHFIGHLDKPLLFAAFGFGATWVSAFGTAIIFGFAAGFGTIASQAYGAKNYYKLGLLYQKVIVVTTALLVSLYIFLWLTEFELRLLGFEPELAYQVGRFVKTLGFDLLFMMIFDTTRFYLFAQNIFHVPALILLFSIFVHTFWCHLFINVFGLELIGIAIARTMTSGTSALLISIYVKLKNPCPSSWFPWTIECLKELGPFAKDIASHGSSIYIEWIAFEFSNMALGYIGDITVIAAHSAAMNYLFTNSTGSLGVVLAMSIFMGNAAGEGSVDKVQKYAYTGTLINVVVVTILDIFMFTFKDSIAGLYTNELSIRGIIVQILTMYFFGMHADLCCNGLAYALRALGQDRFVLKGFIFCYYGIGVTCSILTGIILGYSYYGVWGSLLGGCFIMLVLNIYKFLTLDWEEEVQKIHVEMKKGVKEDDSDKYTLL